MSYGHPIELQHYDSNKMVVVRALEDDEGRNEVSEITLVNVGFPDRCDFTITPRYKYRNLGDSVMFSDYFVLRNEETGVYLAMNDLRLPPFSIS